MRPILIGLTGAIGSGKSSAAAFLAELGAEIISGDELGRIALEGSPQLLSEIRRRFGDGVFASDGTLVRRELGRRVFESKDDARWLTELTFPCIHELWREAVKRTTNHVLVFDAALIPQWDIANEFDYLILVEAPHHVARTRLVESGRLSNDEAEARLLLQAKSDFRPGRMDLVMVNDRSLDDLRIQVKEFWNRIIGPELEKRRRLANAR